MIWKFLTLLAFLAPLYADGQKIVSHTGYYWLRYYNQTKLNPSVTLHTEFDTRRYTRTSKQSQFFAHIHLHKQFKPWLDVAVGFNYNSSKLPATDLNVPELRPWFEFSLQTADKKKWIYLFRYRQDERFIHKNNQAELTDGYHFNMRHRFRVMASTSLANFSNGDKLGLRIYNEIMFNTGDVPRTFDQNRLSASFTYQFNEHWSLESGYIHILQPKTDDEYLVRHVIRTSLYHRLSFIKSSAE